MRILFSILAVLFMSKECDQKKSTTDSTNTDFVEDKQTARNQDKDYSIKYSALSRGIFKEITINSSSISVKKSRDSQPVSKECPTEIWTKITKIVEGIDLKLLSDLEAPTQKRIYDGAAHATLKVSFEGETYASSSFDHGFPPEEIKELCDKLTEFLE